MKGSLEVLAVSGNYCSGKNRCEKSWHAVSVDVRICGEPWLGFALSECCFMLTCGHFELYAVYR